MESGRYVAPDEAGLGEEEFVAKQKERNGMAYKYSAEERNKPHDEYLVFSSPSDKEKALKLIEEYRQIDEAFKFLDNWGDVPSQESGLKLSFTKSPEDNIQKVEEFFRRNDLSVKFTPDNVM